MSRHRSIAVAASGALIAGACLEPTEIIVDITSNDCQQLSHVDIFVGGAGADATPPAPAAVAAHCVDTDGGGVGRLVITPSGSIGDTVAIQVEGAPTPMPCTDDGGCIVARRQLDYTPHHPLTLPIFLDSACAGVPCAVGTTCVATSGVVSCVDDRTICDQAGNCLLDAGPPSGDAGPGCAGPSTFKGAPHYSWSLDKSTFEDKGAFAVPLAVPNTILLTGGVTGCAGYLHTTTPQPLAMSMPLPSHFALAFYYRTTGAATLVQLSSNTVNAMSAFISTPPDVQFMVGLTGTGSNVSSGAVWHAVSIEVDSATLTFKVVIDGASEGPFNFTPAVPSTEDLTLGSAGAQIDFDEVELFVLP